MTETQRSVLKLLRDVLSMKVILIITLCVFNINATDSILSIQIIAANNLNYLRVNQ